MRTGGGSSDPLPSGCASRISSNARQQLRERLSGQRTADKSSPGARYAVWTALDAGFIITLSVHYHDILVKIGVPKGVVVGGFFMFFAVLLLPIPIALGAPLLRRARYGTREVNRVVK